MEIKTKRRGGCCRLRLIGADGDASQKTSVFLLVVTIISNVMQCMTTTAITVQKSGRRPFKKSAFGGEKIAACGSPSLTLPKVAALTFCSALIILDF